MGNSTRRSLQEGRPSFQLSPRSSLQSDRASTVYNEAPEAPSAKEPGFFPVDSLEIHPPPQKIARRRQASQGGGDPDNSLDHMRCPLMPVSFATRRGPCD